MTHAEEVALLRRDLADLRGRVARLEGPKSGDVVHITPTLPTVVPAPVYTCHCAPNTVCGSAACPRVPKATATTFGCPPMLRPPR